MVTSLFYALGAVVVLALGIHAGLHKHVYALLLWSDARARKRLLSARGEASHQDKADAAHVAALLVAQLRSELAEAEARWYQVDPEAAKAAGVQPVRLVASR